MTWRPRAARVAAGLAAALLVAGCGGEGGSGASPPAGTPAAPGASPSVADGATDSATEGTTSGPAGPGAGTVSGAPGTTTAAPRTDRPELTPEGTALEFGESAVVRHDAGRRGTTVLVLTVRSARRGRLADLSGFDVSDPYARNASYYYVRVRVQNVGANRVGPYEAPLRGVSDANTLLPPVRFTADFPPCRSRPVPRGFARGASLDTCLVFLSPNRGALLGVSYRPTTDYDPIVWTGEVAPPPRPRPSRDTGTPGAGS